MIGALIGLVLVLLVKVFMLDVRTDKLEELRKKVDDLHKSKFY